MGLDRDLPWTLVLTSDLVFDEVPLQLAMIYSRLSAIFIFT
jgi:hypothetical protein